MKTICIYGPQRGVEIAQLLSLVLAVLVFTSMLYGVSGVAAFAVFCGAFAGFICGVTTCARGQIVFEESP